MNCFLCFFWMICLFRGALVAENNLCERWDSPEGLLRLQRSEAKENFWKLARFYESQTRLTYCGVATAVIALNALSIQAPQSQFLGKYRLFTQEEFFSENISAVIRQSDVLERGLTLDDLEAIFKTFSIEVIKYEAQLLSHEKIRNLIISALESAEKYILVLYQRGAVKQEGTGHWSPIAAYDAQSDSFLIMDVAKFKYPPSWINAKALIDAMQMDVTEPRGFLIIYTERD